MLAVGALRCSHGTDCAQEPGEGMCARAWGGSKRQSRGVQPASCIAVESRCPSGAAKNVRGRTLILLKRWARRGARARCNGWRQEKAVEAVVAGGRGGLQKPPLLNTLLLLLPCKKRAGGSSRRLERRGCCSRHAKTVFVMLMGAEGEGACMRQRTHARVLFVAGCVRSAWSLGTCENACAAGPRTSIRRGRTPKRKE